MIIENSKNSRGDGSGRFAFNMHRKMYEFRNK